MQALTATVHLMAGNAACQAPDQGCLDLMLSSLSTITSLAQLLLNSFTTPELVQALMGALAAVLRYREGALGPGCALRAGHSSQLADAAGGSAGSSSGSSGSSGAVVAAGLAGAFDATPSNVLTLAFSVVSCATALYDQQGAAGAPAEKLTRQMLASGWVGCRSALPFSICPRSHTPLHA
jgi:hypothetical protein